MTADTAPPPADPAVAVAAAFEAQRLTRDARRTGFDLTARRAALRALSQALRREERAIIAALAADFGKPEAETLLTEILPVQHEIRHALRHLRRWMRPRRVRPTLATIGTSARIVPQPRGVCLIIAPWNYPLNLCLGPLVSCLAAGNSAVIKPSELTPATSALIAGLVARTFAPDLVTVVEGGADTVRALMAHPFDHVFFTGSAAVGREVMAMAARHPTSVTLELGGKSPVIVGPDADIARTAAWIAFGKFANAGQTCIAPDHLFVHESVHDALIAALKRRIGAISGPDGAGPHLARIVSDRHADRLAAMRAGAEAQGATIIAGGVQAGRSVGPALLSGMPEGSTLAREEIFGPLLPVIPYSDIGDVIARINDGPAPLALYVFGRDRARTARILAATTSGGAAVNLTVAHFTHSRLPFGGVGASGTGAAHGVHGFRTFSHERAVIENRFSPLPLVFAPYHRLRRTLIRLAARHLG
ncbi:MAG: aldehyde dehydrogenase family protein [Rubellimicrobium sp.]|nr:aldehyde dehydrogenase family protein [Rubellimicrobium sp.]